MISNRLGALRMANGGRPDYGTPPEQRGYDGVPRTTAMGIAGPAIKGGLQAAGLIPTAEEGAEMSRLSDAFQTSLAGGDRAGMAQAVGEQATIMAPWMMGAGRVEPVRRGSVDFGRVLDARRDQMAMSPADRVRPSGADPLFDTSPQAYENMRYMPEQAPTAVPRTDRPGKLPQGNRSALLTDPEVVEEVTDILAERAKPFLGTPAQYFYHTGPIRKKGEELGLSKAEVDRWLKDFSSAYAATSPRTRTDQNLRNASLVMAKDAAGIPLREIRNPIIDPKTGAVGLNEKGYPMMTGEGGIHGMLLDAEKAGGISPATNPKPATFKENVYGNLQGVTADTHAIRGALDALNVARPGAVPIGFIKPAFKKAYKEDPSALDPATWINDTLASQKINGKSAQTEYAVFSDIYKRMADKLGVSPAEAQSLGWFGSGPRTGLASEMKTIPELIDQQIDITAQLIDLPKDEVFKKLVKREIPLASFLAAGSAAAIGGSGSDAQAAQPVPDAPAEGVDLEAIETLRALSTRREGFANGGRAPKDPQQTIDNVTYKQVGPGGQLAYGLRR